jgi:hypothetical protein
MVACYVIKKCTSKWGLESRGRISSDYSPVKGACGSIVVKALYYKLEGHGFKT